MFLYWAVRVHCRLFGHGSCMRTSFFMPMRIVVDLFVLCCHCVVLLVDYVPPYFLCSFHLILWIVCHIVKFC